MDDKIAAGKVHESATSQTLHHNQSDVRLSGGARAHSDTNANGRRDDEQNERREGRARAQGLTLGEQSSSYGKGERNLVNDDTHSEDGQLADLVEDTDRDSINSAVNQDGDDERHDGLLRNCLLLELGHIFLTLGSQRGIVGIHFGGRRVLILNHVGFLSLSSGVTVDVSVHLDLFRSLLALGSLVSIVAGTSRWSGLLEDDLVHEQHDREATNVQSLHKWIRFFMARLSGFLLAGVSIISRKEASRKIRCGQLVTESIREQHAMIVIMVVIVAGCMSLIGQILQVSLV